MASLFLEFSLGSDADDDYFFEQTEDTGDGSEGDEGDKDHEADTLGNRGLDYVKQQQNELDFWNPSAPMKAGTDVGKGPSVGNDGS